MELSIKPCLRSIYPLGGVLVRGCEPAVWVRELEVMGLPLLGTDVYPLPGRRANSVWGCLVVLPAGKGAADIGRNSYLQLVAGTLFIPERSALYPVVSDAELRALFPSGLTLLHPETGLVELGAPLDWADLVTAPEPLAWTVREPAAPLPVPRRIKSFQVKPVTADDALRQLEEEHFPQRRNFEDGPLNPLEKVKLLLYRQLFRKGAPQEGGAPVEKKPLLSWAEALMARLAPKGGNWTGNLQMDYERLEKRNQKHLDRLLDLLKNNPEEALKYAVPLDEGTGRGGGSEAAFFEFQQRWFNFSLFGNSSSGGSGGGTVYNDKVYRSLHEQYVETAKELLRRGEHRKAAFVYLKLLKNSHLAAEALEEGRHYAEAASVYLKYTQNREKAAQCYEKGAMTTEAIALYKELGQDEKVGDLYMSIHRKKEAFLHYDKVVEGYQANTQYLKASLLCRGKMGSEGRAQDLLMLGWRSNRDAVNCLGAYFSGIGDEKALDAALKAVYGSEVSETNRENFLQVIKQLHRKQSSVSETIEEMAYEIVVAGLPSNPSLATELNAFHSEDRQLLKDTFRFKLGGKKRL